MKALAARLTWACILILGLGAGIATANQPGVRAELQTPKEREPAPAFRLSNASGKAVRLSDYRGKVVLLNLWATDCGGCRVEIPWFIELERVYKREKLRVVGVSIDILYENLKDADEGWSRVKPFVEQRRINYPILMGDDRMTKAYDIQALPVTYLIDKSGHIAAIYRGLVDKNDLEINIKKLLKQR